jgi:hypothetical protein
MEEFRDSELFKGEQMEEQLRAYFITLGYYVIRGAKLKFHGVEVTDVDLWIYNRSTPIFRERINVDIKNRKSPAAIERIIVAKGITEILGYDRCIVATTDNRHEVIEFGEKHGVKVLNGNFLNKTKGIVNNRLTEENFNRLIRDEFSKFTTNWFAKNEVAKSRMLETQDFIIANNFLIDIAIILEQIHSTPIKRDSLIRLLYLFISYLFITVDFILMDMAFIDITQKNRNLEDGFRYGGTSPIKIKLRLEQLTKETGRSITQIKAVSEAIQVDILRDYFGKNDTAKNLFQWAKDFEGAAYSSDLVKPSSLPLELKGPIGLLCDFSKVERQLILNL